ncbi:MAG: collagen-like triple helix repeat-containing protein [Sporichthyaceae bacterium]
MAISLLALSVALGGTSYAAAKITSADVKNDSLRGVDIKDGSLRAKDFGGSLPRGDRGPAGPTGPTGATGAPGPTGPAGSESRWLLVNAAGQIEAQSGGFSITTCYPIAPAPPLPGGANGNCYINANENLSNSGIVASIALQNQVNQGGGSMNGTNSSPDGLTPLPGDNLEFGGEISVTQCAIPMVVMCAPTGTNNANHFVVSPRLSNGERTSEGLRKRFYVIINGNSSDFVTPTP